MLGIVTQAQRVRTRLQALVQLNVELAKLEGKRKATAIGIAAALGVVALVLVLYAIGFLFAAAAVALNEDLALWLALVVVAGAIVLLAVILALVAMQFAKKVSAPSIAVEEAERTVNTLQSHG
jgi:4-amino-4-deoxy-L-arabinose transferase-like glycosyltransferase